MTPWTVDTILFDFDGTLLATDDLVMLCFRHTLAQYGVEQVSDERLRRTFGGLMDNLMQEFVEEYHLKADWREMLREYRAFHDKQFASAVHLFDGVQQLLEELSQRGYRMAVLTSRKRPSTLRGLELFHIRRYFSVVQTADDVPYVKPDPRAAYTVLEQLQASAQHALIVGDSRYDILCGKNAGMYTALALWGRQMAEKEIAALSPDLVARTPAEILAALPSGVCQPIKPYKTCSRQEGDGPAAWDDFSSRKVEASYGNED